MLKGWSNEMIYVQAQVNYSSVSVLLTVFNWLSETRLYFFKSHEILKLICGRINHCLYCQLCLLSWLETLFYLLNMNLVGEQVLLYGEETDVSKTFHLHLYLADALAAISIRKFTCTISEALKGNTFVRSDNVHFEFFNSLGV